jgi:hypothetical protein
VIWERGEMTGVVGHVSDEKGGEERGRNRAALSRPQSDSGTRSLAAKGMEGEAISVLEQQLKFYGEHAKPHNRRHTASPENVLLCVRGSRGR